MKKIVLLFMFLLGAVSAYAGSQPDFTFTDLEKNNYTAESVRGKPVVVYVGSHL